MAQCEGTMPAPAICAQTNDTSNQQPGQHLAANVPESTGGLPLRGSLRVHDYRTRCPDDPPSQTLLFGHCHQWWLADSRVHLPDPINQERDERWLLL